MTSYNKICEAGRLRHFSGAVLDNSYEISTIEAFFMQANGNLCSDLSKFTELYLKSFHNSYNMSSNSFAPGCRISEKSSELISLNITPSDLARFSSSGKSTVSRGEIKRFDFNEGLVESSCCKCIIF